MKKVLSLLLCLFLLPHLIISTNAAQAQCTISYEETEYGNGFVVIDELMQLTATRGTVTLDAKLTKWLVMNIDIDITITCDKKGNISWT